MEETLHFIVIFHHSQTEQFFSQFQGIKPYSDIYQFAVGKLPSNNGWVMFGKSNATMSGTNWRFL